ncbi:iron-sulfur cluster-binding protein [candidate division WOR_3 bacterium SM23_42]|uniref:Iron-sulfur cluster-binding protein n=1 Tax=candidate division WOR_3 bacterium SM23_42 TaxID=1703779 RepID=A0A0S8FYG1_UNCW3|nr:MAG: iron-sulfur cluster-binding protein [candidate division WOR_3 bacterium SM23_42]
MKSTVVAIKTQPKTALNDIERALKMAGVQNHLRKSIPTIMKVNITWHFYFPACSTTPWQFDGAVSSLKKFGYQDLIPAQNRTVVINPRRGAENNHLESVMRKHKLQFVYLYEPDVEWIYYKPKAKMLVLDKVYRDGIQIPKMFVGKNAFHLPTMKTHVFTTITGAMKNAFGGLLNDNRHWTHSVIHETLVDLLQIQKEIHPGIFCLTDGTIAGNGAGPRLMQPQVKNYMLASGDSVAIDAVAAKMMGFDPMKLKFLNLAHEKGLGIAKPSEIRVLGEDISDVNFRFQMKDTFASRGQKAIYWGKLKPFEHLLLRTPIVPWSFVASRVYHDFYWYNVHGKKIAQKYLQTEWGKLFESYK